MPWMPLAEAKTNEEWIMDEEAAEEVAHSWGRAESLKMNVGGQRRPQRPRRSRKKEKKEKAENGRIKEGWARVGAAMALDGTGRSFTEVAAIAGTTATLAGALSLSATRGSQRREGVSLMGINHSGKVEIAQQTLPWWPETLSDSMGTGWSEKVIPGGSHGLMQWGGNSGRTISMTIRLGRSMRYLEDFRSTNALGQGGKVPSDARNLDPETPLNVKHNVHIVSMLYYLRAYCYPHYTGVPGIAVPPVITILNVPGHGLNESGKDYIFSVMTACDITYQRAFEEGKPRLVDVSLSFKQVIQSRDGVQYKGRYDLLAAAQGGRAYQAGANLSPAIRTRYASVRLDKGLSA